MVLQEIPEAAINRLISNQQDLDEVIDRAIEDLESDDSTEEE